MPKTGYILLLKTVKGEFYWTGEIFEHDNFGFGRFLTYGWSARINQAKLYAREDAAKRQMQTQINTIGRLFAFDCIGVQPATETANAADGRVITITREET
jgi:hypothetical protein